MGYAIRITIGADPYSSPAGATSEEVNKELRPLLAADAVVFVDEDDDGFVGGDLFVGHGAVGDNDDQIAWDPQTGGGAVEKDGTRASLGLDDVGDETGPAVDVENLDLFTGEHIGSFKEVAVDGDAAFIVQFRAGEGGTMNLGLEHEALHGSFLRR